MSKVFDPVARAKIDSFLRILKQYPRPLKDKETVMKAWGRSKAVAGPLQRKTY